MPCPESSLDEFGKEALRVGGPVESVGGVRQREDLRRGPAGRLAVDREDPRTALRPVIARLVVRDRILGLLDRIGHEVLANRDGALAPKREVTTVRRPVDRTDEPVFPFDPVLGELGLGVGFLQVDEDHVAATKFHLEFTVRGLGADLRRGQSFRFARAFPRLLGSRPFALRAGLAWRQALVGLDDPSLGVGLEPDAAILQGDRPGERPLLGGHLVLRLIG